MPEKKFVRYAMFGSLYFTQGTILSYFTALNALYFLSRGLSMTSVGIFASIAMIPFVIKIFLGMLSDKVNLLGMGHRKPYILLGLVIQIMCLILVAFVDPAKYYWGFVAIAFVLQMGMALYDTCTDGLALDTIPEDEQGTIQTFMVGGRAVGVVVTASVVGLLAQNVSWTGRLPAAGCFHPRAHPDGAEGQGSRARRGTQLRLESLLRLQTEDHHCPGRVGLCLLPDHCRREPDRQPLPAGTL